MSMLEFLVEIMLKSSVIYELRCRAEYDIAGVSRFTKNNNNPPKYHELLESDYSLNSMTLNVFLKVTPNINMN